MSLFIPVSASAGVASAFPPYLPPRFPFKLPWREAGPPNHLDDKVDSDQQVVKKGTVSLHQIISMIRWIRISRL